MTTNWLIALLGYIEPVALAVALGMLFWRRLAGSWPSLTIALAIEFGTDLSLVYLWHTPGHYKAYFYTYWLTTGIQAAIRMWIMADIVRSFPGSGYVPSRCYLFAGSACTVMALCCGAFCYNTTAHQGIDLLSTVVLMDRCVNIAWVGFIAVLLVSVKVFGFGWSPIGARFANGVFFRICASAVALEMMDTHVEWVRGAGNILGSVSSIAVFSFWAWQAKKHVREAVFEQQEMSLEVSEALTTLRTWIA